MNESRPVEPGGDAEQDGSFAASAGKRGRILWEPTQGDIEASNITALMRWLRQHRTLDFQTYSELWEWSVRDPDQFWGAVWEFFSVEASTGYDAVRQGTTFQDVAWFAGARLNYAQNVLRHERRLGDRPVLICYSEDDARRDWSWTELGNAVRSVATAFRALGIGPGDRIAAFLPNIPEAAVALLAATAIGAVWSSCSPEFGPAAALDRFQQIAPKLILGAPSYRYAGKEHDRRDQFTNIIAGLPSLETVVLVTRDGEDWKLPAPGPQVRPWSSLTATPAPSREEFRYEQVPFQHPLWIVYTSGTSGSPKAVVHSHGGALLGTLKDLGFHTEVSESSRLFFYSTTSWIVWNTVLGSLSMGASLVLYNGSPFHPDIGRLWAIAEQTGTTIFGTSPRFVTKLIENDYAPAAHHALDALKIVVLAGAVAEESTCEWLTEALPNRTRIISLAGSTEICGGYAGGVQLLPIRAGEITARSLGMNVEAVDRAMKPVRGEMAELVISTPFPNAPQRLWNDPDGTRFFQTYLSEFPGVWRQGDIITIFEDGGCRVAGRSDATINRNGIRMGSNEIYRALAAEKRVADAIAVCPQGGRYSDKLLLFVQLAGQAHMSEDLRRDIAATIAQHLSPRHVPDLVLAAPSVPYTATGKRIEVQLCQLLEQRIRPDQFAAALQHDPATADWYASFASGN